jgi:catechol 2,3-dioxygenase-like lactoylglutathione lyase family enzyme
MKIMFAMLLASVAAGAQDQTSQAQPSESAAMNDAANAIAVDHTGFAVSSLDEAIRFWTGALGFTLERQSEMGGDFLHQVTGVDDPSGKRLSLERRTVTQSNCCNIQEGARTGGAVQRGSDRSGPPGSDREGHSCRYCPRRGSRMEGQG